MLTIVTWLWGTKYDEVYTRRFANGIKEHLVEPHRTVLITDRPDSVDPTGFDEVWPIKDRHLTNIPGCFCRLRLFDPNWQKVHGIAEQDQVACIDLDVVVTGNLDPLFARGEPFVILHGANASNPCPVNGSVFMLRAGAYPAVWSDFSLNAAALLPHYSFPDDQAWMAQKIPNAAGWKAGEGGLYAFKKPGWPKGDALPDDARLVVFPGHRDPSQFTHLPWVRDYWLQ